MLSKLRTLLVVGVAALSIAFVAPITANACQGPQCVEVTADSGADGILDNHVITPAPFVLGTIPNSDYAGGSSIASTQLSSEAVASAKEHDVWTEVKYQKTGYHRHGGHPTHHYHKYSYTATKWVKVTVPGEATATASAVMTQTGKVLVISNGPQAFGAAVTIVKSDAKLAYDGSALAIGSPGCPQFAAVDLTGSLTASAWGMATVKGLADPSDPLAQQAWASGSGFTTVSFEGHDSEYDHNGPEADASLRGTIGVSQGLIAEAFVSGDGTFSQTFAAIETGNAYECGRNVDITGMNSSGTVSQGSYATNGQGAYAMGNSSASYNNVANGSAVVFGMNSVVTTPSSVTVSAFHSAHASGSGGGSPQ